ESSCAEPDVNTTQAAVDDIGVGVSPGDTIIVCKGTYNESIVIFLKNIAATSENDRIVLRVEVPADAAAADTDKVIVTPAGLPGSAKEHAFDAKKSDFITIKGFDLRGAMRSAIILRGGSSQNPNITLDGNDIHDNTGCGNCGAQGIVIGRVNAGTVVVNNLGRQNGRSGLSIGLNVGSASDAPIYVVNPVGDIAGLH
ncbi:MAG: hypothetical protein ACE5Q6_22000, partial [Dehalococcoidia bacterium]